MDSGHQLSKQLSKRFHVYMRSNQIGFKLDSSKKCNTRYEK